jgi:hypothetical protein
MNMKRFYIKKSPSDLIQEQNRLIHKFLTKQEESNETSYRTTETFTPYVEPLKEEEEEEEEEETTYNFEEEAAYIPTFSSKGSAKLPSIATKLDDMIDEEDINKLKQRR